MPVQRQLQVAGECRSTQADYAGHAQQMLQPGGAVVAVVDNLARDPFLLAVRYQRGAQVRQAGRMGDELHVDRGDGAGSGSVDRARDNTVGHADKLAFQHALPHTGDGFGGFSGMLVQRDDQFGGQRRVRNGRPGGLRLVAGRMDAAVKMIKRSHVVVASRHSGPHVVAVMVYTGYFHFQLATFSSMTCMLMQSTGQGAMHNSQPVHSEAMTVCICLAAPAMASTGQA